MIDFNSLCVLLFDTIPTISIISVLRPTWIPIYPFKLSIPLNLSSFPNDIFAWHAWPNTPMRYLVVEVPRDEPANCLYFISDKDSSNKLDDAYSMVSLALVAAFNFCWPDPIFSANTPRTQVLIYFLCNRFFIYITMKNQHAHSILNPYYSIILLIHPTLGHTFWCLEGPFLCSVFLYFLSDISKTTMVFFCC